MDTSGGLAKIFPDIMPDVISHSSSKVVWVHFSRLCIYQCANVSVNGTDTLFYIHFSWLQDMHKITTFIAQNYIYVNRNY